MQDIGKFWDDASKGYRHKQWEQSAVAKFDFKLTKSMLLKFLKPNRKDKILEIGCGPGKWTMLVSRKCGKLTAIDVSSKMIMEARQYCTGKNVHFIHGDINELQLEGKFDKIFAVRSIEYVKDKDRLLKKLQRLLKQDGTLLIITKSSPCLWGITNSVKNFWQSKISFRRLKELCEKNGFKKVTFKPVILRLPVFSSGNRELPLIRKKHEGQVLKYFYKITKRSQKIRGFLVDLPMFFSESYLLYAKR